MVENPPASAGDPGSIPGSRRSPGGEHGNLLQLPWTVLENPIDKGARQTAVHAVTRVRHDLATKEQQRLRLVSTCGRVEIEWKIDSPYGQIVINREWQNMSQVDSNRCLDYRSCKADSSFSQ